MVTLVFFKPIPMKFFTFLFKFSCNKIISIYQYFKSLISFIFNVLILHGDPFLIHLSYFFSVSLFGFFALKVTKFKSDSNFPIDLDLFFTSVSATTLSSMSTVEMEVFSNTQLVIITILMLISGEVFTSMLDLQLTRSKFVKQPSLQNIIVYVGSDDHFKDQIELSLATLPRPEHQKSDSIYEQNISDSLCYSSTKCLSFVILGYLLVVHLGGSVLVSLYFIIVSSARKVLENKGIKTLTFAVFITVSTFANCGFVPINESMIVFKTNSGLLLLLIPQIFLGNTLYPHVLRYSIWVLEKTLKRVEFSYILRNFKEIGYGHLLSSKHSCFLGVTVIGFVLFQFILFCSMEWNSEVMNGLHVYQKLVASLFQIVNSRYSGESVFDLSIISPAILVLFLVMMYLPPQTSYFPTKEDEKVPRNGKEGNSPTKTFLQYFTFSQLSYLAIFIILICIIERDKMKEDPLNFNVLNITIEVISAYGNVGFSMGYSCERQLQPESYCKNRWYGFVGRWSNYGKLVLIVVMFFGRLKKFSTKCGKAWKLS